MALVNRPSGLFLDEPLGALDLKLREEMQIELKRSRRTLGFVRPEKIHLDDPGETPGDGDCSARGSVRAVVYLGVNTRYIVALENGAELVVVQQNQSTSSMHVLAQRGKRVLLIWRREHNRTVATVRPTPRSPEEVPA